MYDVVFSSFLRNIHQKKSSGKLIQFCSLFHWFRVSLELESGKVDRKKLHETHCFEQRKCGRGLACLRTLAFKEPAFPKFLEKVQRTLFLLGMERFVALVHVETQQFLGPLTVSGPMRRPSASGGTLLARALPSNLSVVISSFCRLSLRYFHLKALWPCGHRTNPSSTSLFSWIRIADQRKWPSGSRKRSPAAVIAHQYIWPLISAGPQLFPARGSTLLPRMELVITNVAAWMMPKRSN